ncbi:helix-turn-helix domain-containing protein [Ktedonospora formicarum]|uniref:Helix-turn-helix domain-containing protein n=1 Tax=Ktedonospora formicarum TaxID=2778364 RepID=A0A8J3ICI2_9CHLR|nr:helix-turn-helix domain-containing protein [Ktedonospora formicarum]GHO51511.1 hypothetical protein KSX_96740 [Ktedonospora formicarum]
MQLMAEQEKREPVLYSIKEACELLRVSDDTVRRMIKANELDAVKVRGAWRIKKDSLDKYIK